MTSTEPAQAALHCHEVSKRFAGNPVVTGLDLTVPAGDVLALLGPSGCGKTTALRLIAGFEPLDAGTITVGDRVVACRLPGQPTLALPPEQRRVSMVFQDYALFPHLTVGENVGFGLRQRRDQPAISAMLAGVGLAGYADRDPASLSGGQQQRVALARALAVRPELLLLDEPFSNLDVGLRAAVRDEVIQIIRAAGTTAVLVTHDQEEALSLADRVALMLDGRIAQVDSPLVLYDRPVSPAVASFVGEATFLDANAAGATATCCLGPVALRDAHAGAVTLLIRPESITVRGAGDSARAVPGDGAGGDGVVTRSRFLGHAQLATIRLAAGPTVSARLPASPAIRPGDQVRVSITVPLHAWSATSAPES